MGSRMNRLGFSAVLAVGLVLSVSDPGEARQRILQSDPAVQKAPIGPYDGLIVRVTHNYASLSWQPSNDPRVVGYRVWKGTDPLHMSAKKVGNVTSYTFDGLGMGNTWYFCVTAYDKRGNESAPSNMVTKSIAKIKGPH